jgi:RimJ/RimL family protein N-acetyltransferase
MDICVLSDGTAVEIRAIRADDGERLRASHGRLSDESRYRRFLGAKPQLSASDAHYLVDIDGCDHFALVATAEDEIIAVTRFVRAPDDPAAAEFAIVVGDEHQRQGLAGELLPRLAAAAAARGVRRFRATILTDNVAIRRLMRGIAADELAERRLGTVSEVEFELAAAREPVLMPAGAARDPVLVPAAPAGRDPLLVPAMAAGRAASLLRSSPDALEADRPHRAEGPAAVLRGPGTGGGRPGSARSRAGRRRHR